MTFKNQWTNMCLKSVEHLGSGENERQLQETALVLLEDMKGAVHSCMEIACPACGGCGSRCYGSTSTWRGGMGGAAMTPGVCDKCWGTGRTDKTGLDLRKVESSIKTAERKASLRWFEESVGAKLATMQNNFPKIAAKLRKARWGDDFWLHRCVDVVSDVLERLVEADLDKEE